MGFALVVLFNEIQNSLDSNEAKLKAPAFHWNDVIAVLENSVRVYTCLLKARYTMENNLMTKCNESIFNGTIDSISRIDILLT